MSLDHADDSDDGYGDSLRNTKQEKLVHRGKIVKEKKRQNAILQRRSYAIPELSNAK